MVDSVISWKKVADNLRREMATFLSAYEGSPARVFSLNESYRKLSGMSVLQDELFRESFRCLEAGLYRASYVMAWAAFIDFLEHKISEDGLVKLRAIRPNWSKHKSIEELRESVPEHQIIEAARDLDLFSKNEAKSILGLLSKRNECAHPSAYKPDLNDSLGYITELLGRLERLAAKSL